jgi:hypothetical protein
VVVQQPAPCREEKDCGAEKLIGFLIGVFTVIALAAIVFLSLVLINEYQKAELIKDNYCISLGFEEHIRGSCYSDGEIHTVDKYGNVIRIDTETTGIVKKGKWVYK